MPSPFPQPTKGRLVKDQPTGFPAFFDKRKPRVVTADPWAFLNHLIDRRVRQADRSAAFSYINQAFDFFEAARNPQIGSKPLLYYYSFLNLAKASLLIHKVDFPVASKHGISDPRANQRTRLRLPGQRVAIEGLVANHSQLFPEFIHILGGNAARRTIPVVQLLAQIPSIHRTFCRVANCDPLFMPVKRVRLLRDEHRVWARVVLDRFDKDVRQTFTALKGRRAFEYNLFQTTPFRENQIYLEMFPVQGRRRGIDKAIRTLAGRLRDVGISTILTSSGYRYYFCNIEPRHRLPQLGASYAAFFYLGSITRYRPDDFDKILEGGYSWVVWELLATEPVQFLYTLASELAGVDVVRPYATSQ